MSGRCFGRAQQCGRSSSSSSSEKQQRRKAAAANCNAAATHTRNPSGCSLAARSLGCCRKVGSRSFLSVVFESWWCAREERCEGRERQHELQDRAMMISTLALPPSPPLLTALRVLVHVDVSTPLLLHRCAKRRGRPLRERPAGCEKQRHALSASRGPLPSSFVELRKREGRWSVRAWGEEERVDRICACFGERATFFFFARNRLGSTTCTRRGANIETHSLRLTPPPTNKPTPTTHDDDGW